jgi:hypothetical protein
MTRTIPGSQIQRNSFFITDHPRGPKKDWILIGETWMGVQGRKNLSEEKGARKATPLPPFVRASRKP